MQLTSSERVYFEPTSHSYLLDGERLLIGVTSLMKKHGLAPDYSNIPEKVLNKAAEEGTAIHRAIQDYENGESVLSPFPELIDAYRKLGLQFIASEYQVTDFEITASAIDGVYKGQRKNGVLLVDYKSTLKVHRRALEWQLGIYKVLFENLNPDLVVEGCYCLWIDKKSKSINELIPIEPVSRDEVLALLDAERNGLIYIDESATQDISSVIPESQLAAYVGNAIKVASLKAQIKALQDEMDAYDARVLSFMEERNLTELKANGGVFKRKSGSVRTTVDTSKLKNDFPAVYNKVAKTSMVKGSVTFKPDSE